MEARTELIAKALAAADDGERHSIQWRGDAVQRDVISIPLTAVLLSSRSHRIRAELESHPRRDAIAADPYSEQSQADLAELLAAVPRFDDLVADLAEYGQQDPGIVTSAGVLVNANRRAVALRHAGKDYIKVMVLPQDATQIEIDRLELELQVKREFKEPYTFTNELLFIQDLVTEGNMTHAQVQEDLRLKNVAEVRQKLRILGMIREVQDMEPGIPLRNFDEQKIATAFEELDDSYEKLRSRDPDGAQQLKGARLLAIMAGTGYREVRFIDETFVETHLQPTLADEGGVPGAIGALLEPDTANDAQPPEIELLTGGTDEAAGPDIGVLYRKTLEARSSDSVDLPAADGTTMTVASADFINTLKIAIEDASADARDAQDGADRLVRPANYLTQADAKLRKALDGLKEVKDDPAFEAGDFDAKLATVERRIQAIRGTLNDDAAG